MSRNPKGAQVKTLRREKGQERKDERAIKLFSEGEESFRLRIYLRDSGANSGGLWAASQQKKE